MITLSYTRTCPLACRHCFTESSPQARGKMDFEQARRYVESLPGHTSSTCFTGGEPLLYHGEIVELTRLAKAQGLKVSVVTGAGWVKDEVTTTEKVGELVEAGLEEMLVSWDAYHEEFQPREKAVMLARLAAEAGIEVSVRTILTAEGQADGYHTAFLGLPVELEIGRVIRVGEAVSLAEEDYAWDETLPKGSCPLVFRPLIDHDGTVYACCGPSLKSPPSSPLVLGNAESEPLEEILERAAADALLDVISRLGPYGLYLLIKDHPTAGELFSARSRYSGICDLCLDINNSPGLVAAVRERLKEPKVQAFLATQPDGVRKNV